MEVLFWRNFFKKIIKFRLKHKCLNKGELVILLKDQYDHVFGGFMANPLEIKSGFFGNGECFLFSIKVNKI